MPQHRNDRSHEPMFNFSEPVPVYWAGLLIILELLTMVATREVQLFLAKFGILRPYGVMGFPDQLIALVGHSFLHSGWSHVLMNSFLGIIFGIVCIRGAKVKKTAQGQSSSGLGVFLGLFLFGAVLGGLAQWAVWAVTNASVQSAMLGASGGVSAFFAGAGWAMGGRQKMLQFGFGWLVINFVLVIAEPIFGVRISWAGHIGGYVAGMILAPLWIRPNSTGFSVLR